MVLMPRGGGIGRWSGWSSPPVPFWHGDPTAHPSTLAELEKTSKVRQSVGARPSW